MNEKCFGLTASNKGNTVCSVREVNPGQGCPQCIGYANCPFYKPKWKQEKDLRNAYARIRTLPMATQRHISEKYYEGEMPWYSSEA